MNPLTILDSILADYASQRVRRLIHAGILLAVALVTIWQSVDGDWEKALIALGVALYAAANKANTPATPLDPAGHDSEPDDDLSYEEAGGGDFPDEHPEDYAPEPDEEYITPVSGNLS